MAISSEKTKFNENITINVWFEAQVERRPEAVAVVFEDKQLRYRELNHRANQLAHYLQSLGVGPESLVGICMERSLEIVVGILAILKAGGAYVPIDPAYPKERIAFIVEETQVAILLTQKHLVNELPQLNSRLICIDTEWKTIARESEKNLITKVTPENLAYLIYTSGSTGKPKGVEIPHRNINHYVQAMSKALQLDSKDIYLHTASFSFSSSVRQLMIALSQGATIVIATAERIGKPLALFELIKQHHITIIDLVPSYWRTCTEVLANLETEQRNNLLDNQLRLILSASEPLLSDIPKNWRLGFKQDVRFINMYGQTETTGIIAVYPIPDQYEDKVTIVPIGKPIADTQIYILDEDLHSVPVGEIGEMYIGGTSLTRSYHKRPDLTEKILIANPFSDPPGTHLYKTGDLARYLPDGNIAYVGRVDYQVKIRGKRVELGEIESIIALYPGVNQTVVMGKQDASGNTQLVAYVVPKTFSNEINQTVSTKKLRNYLKEKLPEYMVPYTFVVLPAFPLTPSGKIDRRAIPAPEKLRQELEETLVAPRDDLELQLTKIWEKVFGVQPISIRHNFFELGGSSLIAVRLVAEIERIWSRKIPLTTFFQTATVEGLASILRQKELSPAWSYLVPIQATRFSKPPLFCIHPIGGSLFEYYPLFSYLDKEQPVYGLQAQGFDDKQPPQTRVEDMANNYITEIRTVQPKGPYFLLGYSFGGVIAFEMAQQLYAQGDKVALLGLLDTKAPKLPIICLSLAQAGLVHLRNLSQLGIKEKLNYFKDRIEYLFTKSTYKDFAIRNLSKTENISSQYLKVLESNIQASKDYIPQVYPGDVHLFRCQVQSVKYAFHNDLGWSELVSGNLKIHPIPGEHSNILKGRYVAVLAENLKLYLDNI